MWPKETRAKPEIVFTNATARGLTPKRFLAYQVF